MDEYSTDVIINLMVISVASHKLHSPSVIKWLTPERNGVPHH